MSPKRERENLLRSRKIQVCPYIFDIQCTQMDSCLSHGVTKLTLFYMGSNSGNGKRKKLGNELLLLCIVVENRQDNSSCEEEQTSSTIPSLTTKRSWFWWTTVSVVGHGWTERFTQVVFSFWWRVWANKTHTMTYVAPLS